MNAIKQQAKKASFKQDDESEARRAQRKLQDALEATRKLTRTELKQLVASILEDLLKREMVQFLRERRGFVEGVIFEAFKEFLTQDRFAQIVENMFYEEVETVRRVIEDTALSVYAAKEERRAGGSRKPGKRKIRL